VEENARSSLLQNAYRAGSTYGFSPLWLPILKLDVPNVPPHRDKLFIAFIGPDDFVRNLARTERVRGYHQDNSFALFNRLPCLYQVRGPWNTIALVTPRRVTRLFQPKGDFQCAIGVFFHMGDENITH